MKNTLLALTFVVLPILGIANNDSIVIEQLKEQISIVENNGLEQGKNVKQLQNEVVILNQKLKQQAKLNQEKVDSLKVEIDNVNNLLMKSTKELKGKIGDVELFSRKMTHGLEERLEDWSFVGATTFILFAFIITVVIILLYWLFKKRIKSSSSAIDSIKNAQSEISNAQKQLQEDALKLDEKLIDLLDKKLNIQQTTSVPTKEEEKEVDHSLAKKVADEIVRIELNLSRMDVSVKGHKQLSKAVERIKNNFLARGYEIVDMLGKPYNEGMKVVANFIMDDTLKEGEQKITGITKPQINYNGTMIQAAEITVSQNI